MHAISSLVNDFVKDLDVHPMFDGVRHLFTIGYKIPVSIMARYRLDENAFY